MRSQILLLASLLGCLAPLETRAQVSVDPRALDQLNPPGPAAPAKPPVRAQPARPTRAAPAPAPSTPPGTAAAAMYGPPRPPPAAPSTVPAAPPPGPVIPPPIVVPVRPVPPPPPVQVVADAPGEALPLKNGLRVTFGGGRADLNKLTDAALRIFVHSLPPFDSTVFTLTASAAIEADDPSTPRRLALSRALAVRGTLLAEGVTSPRIIVKVIGAIDAKPGDGPADRVDVVAVTGKSGAVAPPPSGGPKP